MYIAGVDEAGRGPLAGDVVAAAVILDPENAISGIADSKRLSAKRRGELESKIKRNALSWCIGRASVAEIDRLNILHAAMLAMRRAVIGLAMRPDLVRVDGNRAPPLAVPCETIVKGDAMFEEIGAASILAKEARDRDMLRLAKTYPQYGFERHKGYPTREHIAAINAHGVTRIHRTSFAPVRNLLEDTSIY